MTDGLIQEVDDSLREERIQRFWRENGSYIIAGCLLAILVTALISGYRNWNDKIHAHDTALVLNAIDADNMVQELGSVAPIVRPGTRVVALMTAAGKLFQEGQVAEAKAQFDILATDEGVSPIFRDLAQLQSARLGTQLLEGTEAGALDVKANDLLDKLLPLWQKVDSPWRFHARYQAGLIAGAYLKDYDLAHEHLSAVQGDDNLIDSLKQRAAVLDHVYLLDLGGTEAAKEKDAEG